MSKLMDRSLKQVSNAWYANMHEYGCKPTAVLRLIAH